MRCSLDGCTNKAWRHELCQRHYAELSKDGRFSWPSPEQRFWNKVDRRSADECWPWIGAINGNGYGNINWHGRITAAHRIAYELAVGPIPEGLVTDHVCHTLDESCRGGRGCLHRRCVNPAHIEPVTDEVNWRRGRSPHAEAARKTHCSNGHEFTPENTRIYVGRPNARVCLTCKREKARLAMRKRKDQQREYMRAYRARKRAEGKE